MLIFFEYGSKFSTVRTGLLVEIIVMVFMTSISTTSMFKMSCHLLFKDLIYTKAAMVIFQSHMICSILLKSDSLVDFLVYFVFGIISLFVLMPLCIMKLNQLCHKLYYEKNPNFAELKRLSTFIKVEATMS